MGWLVASGSLEDAMDPGFHCVTTHWIPGFMAFPKGRPGWGVMPMVSE
jgi:hypothetical protein